MDEEFDFLKPQKVFFLDTNLSSPVLITEIQATKDLLARHRDYILSTKNAAKWTARQMNQLTFFRKLCVQEGWKSVDLVSYPTLNPSEYPDIEAEMLKNPQVFSSFYEEAKSIALEFEEAVAAGLRARGLPPQAVEGTANTLGGSHVAAYRSAYEQFSNIYARAECRVKRSEYAWTKGTIGAVTVWITPTYALLSYQGQVRVSSANQILMLKDKLATRYMLLEHVIPLSLRGTLVTHLKNLFEWQDYTLRHYGNSAYGILKAVEPMYKTRVSHLCDNVFGSDTAYTRMIVKMQDKEDKVVKLLGRNCHSIRRLQHIVEKVNTIDELVEMFGCQKSCGHPLIDPIRGGLSAAGEARSPDRTSLVDAQCLRNTFCHIVLSSYISRHGRWPPLTFLRPGLTLEIMFSRQERNISYHSYELSEWTFVEWGKLFEMDYFPNFLELMDDKAISLYRSEKHLSWEENAHPSSQRRLLLEVLRRKNIAIKEIVDRVSRRDVPFDWRIVSLYPKEREFKEDPRMFAMLPLEMRCFFTCIEANIADNVFKYMPQQTMTKTKTQIQERFLSFTDPTRDPNNLTLFLEIDLSRWNLRWRQMVIHMIGHDLNRMFGVKGTFTVTHWFFAVSQIMVRVGGLRPEGIEKEYPPETGLAWRNHLGGFEGLNQKLWTAATYAMVEMALQPLLKAGVISSYELIGQGDNQVLRISIPRGSRPREEILKEVRDLINKQLEKTCASVNQEVKPEENVESTSVLTYSKDFFVGGVEYPTTLKKHSRLFPVTSNDFPSTAMNAAAIMAGTVAAAESSRHSLRSMIVGVYHTSRYLLAASAGYTIHGKRAPKFSRDAILGAIALPPSIGGYIGLPVASFFYKGGSDPLGKEISSLRLLADSSNQVGLIAGRALRALEEKYYIDQSPNLEVLIENPYGLPIDKRTSPLSRVSHLTLDAFRPRVQNQEIKPLLSTSVSVAESRLKEDILSVRPLNPILAHDLFEASGFGTVKVMRKMFLQTRTVQSVAQWVDPNITHVFLRADINDMLWFLGWFKGLPCLSYSRRNSYELVSSFRRYWGVELHGVTNYQPLDYYHSAAALRHPSSLKWSSHSARDLLFERGPLSGYLGTATREKRSEHGYKIVDAGAPSRAMMKLQLIRSQANGNLGFNELLDRIGMTRTNCKLSDITDLLDKVYGGSISHKYSSTIRSMSASYVGPLNFVTHIRLDTDSLGKVSGSVDNYSIMTQEFMVYTLAGAKLLNVHCNIRMGELIIPTEGMTPIPGDALECPEPEFTVASLPRSRLLFTPDLLLVRTYDSLARSVPRHSIIRTSEYSNLLMIEHAFTGFFLSLLRDKSKAKALADTRGLAATPASLQIDIAEAHALGPNKLARCMARGIYISTLRDTFRTLHIHPDRWDESLFMVNTIRTCVSACMNYLRHPLFNLHPDSNTLRHSRLKYAGSVSIQRRLEALVRKHLIMMTRTTTHPFWSEDIPVFAGESAMTIAEALTTACAKRVYGLYQIKDPRAREFSNLYSSFTRLPVGVQADPESQLSLLRSRITSLAGVYRKAGDIILSDQMMRLSHLYGVCVFNDDFKTVMRYSRLLHVAQGQPRARKVMNQKISPLGTADVCPQCFPTPREREEMMWRRYQVRIHGGVSSAGYTWLPLLADLTIQKSVWVVGSGNGGLADVLLSTYDCEVTGTDLERDMPRDVATLMNYIPIGISPENSSRYTQSDLSISTSGDWFDSEVRQEILQSLFTVTTLIADITAPDIQEHTNAITDVMGCMFVDRYYTRIEGGNDFIRDVYTEARKRWSVRMWATSSSYHSSEVILEVSRASPPHLHTCERPTLTLDAYIQDEYHAIIPPRIKELVEAATESVVSWDGETLEEMNDMLKSMMVSLLNKPRERQLLYKDRISLIIAYMTVYMACDDDPMQLLQEWIQGEEIETDMVRISMRPAFLTHLLRYVPRLRAARPLIQ